MISILEEVQKEAISFLIQKQSQEGSWEDFNTLAGTSDQWVTAYSSLALAGTSTNEGAKSAEAGFYWLLKKNRLRSGWSYNQKVPIDADTTAWVIRLAERLNKQQHRRVKRAVRKFDQFSEENGGIKTFGNDLKIRIFTKLNKKVSFEGWCSVHNCVTANAAFMSHPNKFKMQEYLRSAQKSEGYWKGYWWRSHEYPTLLAIEAICSTQKDQKQIEKATNWARNHAIELLNSERQNSVFSAAILLNILLYSKNVDEPLVYKLFQLIKLMQKRHGGWFGVTPLQIAPPGVIDPEKYTRWVQDGKGGGSIVYDQNGIYTTATVLFALNHLKEYYDRLKN